MIIGFLKYNRVLAVFVLPLLMLLIGLYGFLHTIYPDIEQSSTLYKLLIRNLYPFPFLITAIAFILILLEAYLLNYLIRENELIHINTALPGVVYMLFMCLQPSMYTLHAIVIANLFMLLAIHKLMQTYRKEASYSKTFDTGLCIAMASLFYPPSLVFIILLWVSLIILRPFIWREWIISLIGFMLPWLFVFVYYYCFNDVELLCQNAFYKITTPSRKFLLEIHFSIFQLVQIGILLVSFILSISYLIYSPVTHSSRTRNNNVVVVCYFLLSAISILFSSSYSTSSLSFMAIPFAIFFSNFLLCTQRQVIAELLLMLLIISIFLNQYIN